MAPRNATLNRRKREHAQAAILQAAHELFVERGYEATTLAKIAERAGVSVGLTVYYFRTKQHLVQALADRLFHAPIVALLNALPADTEPDQELAILIDTILRTAAAEPVIVALHLALLLQPGVADLLVDAERDYEDELGRINQRIRHSADDDDPATAALLRRTVLMGAVYSMLSPYLPLPVDLARSLVFAHYGLDLTLGRPER